MGDALQVMARSTGKDRVANGSLRSLLSTQDGALHVADYILAAALEGRLFEVSLGTLTTPITFKAYDADQPELAIDVPAGTTIIPVHIDVHLEDSTGTDNEVIAITSTSKVGPGTSTTLSPLSSRTNKPVASACAAYGAYSGNGTAPTTHAEFWRCGDAFADAATKPPRLWSWDIRTHTPQIIVGDGSLVLYISATTTQAAGFVKASWLELPSEFV